MTKTKTGVLADIDLIVFDAFGTLLEIGSRRRPVAHLRRRMSPEKASQYRRLAMRKSIFSRKIKLQAQNHICQRV